MKSGTAAVGVFVKQAHTAEGFLASRARVLFGLQMGLQVCPQIGLVCKASSAIVARERFFTGVNANMPLEKPRSRETFSANVTLARQRVCANVHLQSRERGVTLVAKFA